MAGEAAAAEDRTGPGQAPWKSVHAWQAGHHSNPGTMSAAYRMRGSWCCLSPWSAVGGGGEGGEKEEALGAGLWK